MSKYLTVLPSIFESYKKWVRSNPQVVSEVETAVKWASYFIAGRINSSPIISELIYSLSNLIVLYNDRIIEKSRATYIRSDSETQLKIFLTTLEYCEVFIEISARKLWGDSGRWFFIFLVQLSKCLGRLLLTYSYKETITQSPPIPALNRKSTEIGTSESTVSQNESEKFGASSSFTFTLKRSGKVVRKVEGAPPIHLRNWKPAGTNSEFPGHVDGTSLTFAESIYIFKPLIHLGGIAKFGLHSWKSYCLALLLDFTSLRLYHKNRLVLSKKQKVELSKRCVSLLLYLVRSPFYDKYTKNKINAIINAIGQNIPLTSAVCNPVLEYIPHWQSTYFYMWST